MIHQMQDAGESQTRIAATTGLSRGVVGRVIRGEIPSLAKRFAAPAATGELPFYEEA
jgi:hypothetical protein